MTVENTRKLTFRSFDEDTFKEKNAKAEYEVMMTPANIIRTLSTKKDKTKPRGAVGSDGKWMGLESETYKFDLIFDGTGLVKENADVEEEIDKFLKVVYMADQKRGQQNFVEISYGDMVVNCKMATMNIDYQLFNREGKPIRAKVQCSFTSVNPFTVRKKDKKKKKDNNNACPPPCSCAEVEKKARASNADFMSIDKPENYMSIK